MTAALDTTTRYTKRDQERFHAIRRRYVQAAERRAAFQTDTLLKRYGQTRPPQAWLTRTEADKLDRYDRAIDRETFAMFDLLDRVSPRYWRAGIAAWWVVEELTWEDATTTGPLAVVPRAGYGTTQGWAARFAAEQAERKEIAA